MNHHPIIALCLLLASCAAPSVAEPFGRPAEGVTKGILTNHQSRPASWRYKINTLDGPWIVVIEYGGRPAGDADAFHATITFPDKTTRVLPGDAVTLACRAISEEPEVATWAGTEGAHILSIGGSITATRSEGQFNFKGRAFLGATVRETTLGFDGQPDQHNTHAFLADGARTSP